MNWQEALEIVIAITRHAQYREHCSEADPRHEEWRAIVIRMASNPPDELPPIEHVPRGGCCG